MTALIFALEGITSSLGNTFNATNFLMVGKIISYVMLGVGLAIIVWLFIIRPTTFKIKVIIIARRSGGMPQIAYDKGKYIRKDRIEKFIFLKRSGVFGNKLNIASPNADDRVVGEKGESVLIFEKFGEFDYRPLHVSDTFQNSPFIPTDANVKAWMVLEQKLALQKYQKQTFWQQYGPIVFFLGAMVLIMIMLWMTLGKVSEISGALGASADRFAQAVADFGKQIVSARGGV
jgi:hypothetical protein